MNTKTITATALFLLLGAFAPAALGHDDSGNRYRGVDTGVSGTYVMGTSPYVEILRGDAFDLGTSLDDSVQSSPYEPAASPYHESGLPFSFARTQIICDMEVAAFVGGDGAFEFVNDEPIIDGFIANTLPHVVPDGTWDDGGLGGACHTDHYDIDDYNTPGCPSGVSFAEDLGGVRVFIGAACDYGTIEGGTPQLDILMTCTVEGLATNHPEHILVGANPPPPQNGCVQDFLQCAIESISEPDACTVEGTFVCGSDGVVDDILFGDGTTGVAYPSWSYLSSGCPLDTVTAITFVYDAVENLDGVPFFLLASTGVIWQGASPSWPDCLEADSIEPVVSQRFCANPDSGSLCVVWVSAWVPPEEHLCEQV